MPIRVLFFSYLFFTSYSLLAQIKTIEVANPSDIARDELVEIAWDKVVAAFPSIDKGRFKIINAKTQKEYPYQLEYKGKQEVQTLLIQTKIAAKATLHLHLISQEPAPAVAKTFCRYVPERKDDFAWENDKIAFRMYGKALENTPKEMAYGIDVWVKNTSRLIINERYKRGEYHINHGDGMDYYHVGLTLGAGGMAPFINDTIWHSKNYREWKVLDNGPLRSSFQLSYDEWPAGGIKLRATKTISIDAGAQLNRAEIKYSYANAGPLPIVAGIVKRKENGSMLLGELDGVLAYWEPKHGNDGTTGIACIMPTPIKEMMIKDGSLLAATFTDDNGAIVYYHGAAWDKAGAIRSAADWFKYVSNFKNNLAKPLIIKIK